jgi:hypothetical protein
VRVPRRATTPERSAATTLAGAPAPAAAQSYTLPAGAQRFVAVRAIDDQGNVGLPAVVRYKAPKEHK